MNRLNSFLIVVGVFFLALGVGFGVTKFQFSNDYREFFSGDNPQLRAWDEIKKTYIKSDSILIVINPKQGDVFYPDVIRSIHDITEEGWRIPYAVRVDSLTNYQNVFAEGDDIVVEDLVYSDDGLTAEKIAKVREVALTNPKLTNLVVSPDGKNSAIIVTVQLSEAPRQQIEEIEAYMETLIPSLEARHEKLDFYISGSVAYNYSLSSATKNDLKTIVLYMYGVVLAILFLLFRSVIVTLIGLLLITLTNASAMGTAAWFGTLLMAPNLSAPTILMTLVVANYIHILVAFFRHYDKKELKAWAIKEALKKNRKPIIIANVTTSLGFLTMNFSDVPPYHDLGNIVAVGVIYILFLTLFWLPNLLFLLPINPRSVKSRSLNQFYPWVSQLVTQNAGTVCISFAVLVVFSVIGLGKLELNDRFAEWMSPQYKFRTDTDYINQHLTGLYMLEWSLDSGEPGGINDPKYLEKLEGYQAWMERQPGVIHVASFVTHYKELHQDMLGGEQRHYRIPDNKALAAQLLLVYEMSLPMGLDINNMVDIDKSSTRFVVRTSNLSANELLDLESRGQQWLKDNALPSMVSPAASTTILFCHIAQRNIKSLLGGTIIALILISLIMIVPFRSIKYGMLSLVPNLFPTIVAFGVWGFLMSNVGLAISIVVGMTMGVIVDDSVHFITKYLYFKREKSLSAEQAIAQTLSTVGPAITGTSLILVAGFSVLALSGLNLNSQMGVLTSITVAIAWVADMFLLPAILLTLDGKSAKERNLEPVVQ